LESNFAENKKQNQMKRISLFTTATILAFTVSCTKTDSTAVQQNPKKDDCGCSEEVYKGRNVESTNEEGTLIDGRNVSYSIIDGKKVLEGDIILTDNQLLDANTGTNGTISTVTSHVWPSKTVVYAWGSGISQATKDKFTAAAAHWNTNTGIKFTLRTTQTNYVRVIEGGGCYSNIGRTGGAQDLSIGSGCTTGNTIHEIGHAVGLYHEHTRSDRDTYVNVFTQNVIAGRGNNFVKCSNCTANGTLDFGSIMMYSSFAFSSNGQATITRKNGTTFTTQRDGLSANDIAIVKTKYP
jgi:hypothetical protein